MSIDIGEILSEGFNRTIQRNGLIIAGLLFVTGLLNLVLSQTVTSDLIVRDTTAVASQPLALEFISPAVAGILWIPAAILSVIVGIVAIRTFVSDETETIPEEFYQRNMLMTALNIIVGGIVFALILILAFGAPIAPGLIISLLGLPRVAGILLALIGGLISIVLGLYILVSLYFWTVFVAVEDQNFIEGLDSSWNATRNNRFELFILGVIVVISVFVFNFLLTLPISIVTFLAGASTIQAVYSQLPAAITAAFTTATMAQAYNQLTEQHT